MANVAYKQLEIVEAAATIIIQRKAIERDLGGFQTYVRTILPMECDNAVLTIIQLFAADRIEDVEVKSPLNWWEALKEAHAPQMVLDRWPVKYKRVIVNIKAIWKGYRPPTDKWGPCLPYVYTRTVLDGTE